MRKLTNDEVGKLPTNPIFDGLPDSLKDTARYIEIERQMQAAIHSDHKHASVKGFVKCKRCLPKLQKRQALLKELGFASYGQYAEWRRVMTVILTQSDLHFNESDQKA